ncbi:hypothetical protein NKDENANG_04138 [Candidatus Entotheonellaceae bacterium PAL068K]
MSITAVALWFHVLAMVVVLGGYTFLSVFWWPALRRATDDVRLQVSLLGQTLRRFFPVVVVALMIQVVTGGLYLLPPAYRAFGSGDEAALATFHLLLLIKLGAAFLVLILVPMQLFGMASRLTRMDAGVYPFDPQAFTRIAQRLQVVSYLIIGLLTVMVVLSLHL